MINCLQIIQFFYPDNTPLRRLLMQHSTQVRDTALRILSDERNAGYDIDVRLVSDGAMLHDIGIFQCHAPSIFCEGKAPYIAHGVTGAAILREYGHRNGLDLEAYARICERHTGSGITADEVRAQNLPLEARDYLPETLEEKLICLADKLWSKSSPEKEKTIDEARRSLIKFGVDSVDRFDELCKLFHQR